MKKLMFLFLAMLLALTASAERVTAEQALQQARQFMTGKSFTAAKPLTVRSSRHQAPGQQADAALYVVNAQGQGFVIVSGDDRTIPILGYSDNGQMDTDNMPEHVKAWMQGYADQIAWLEEHPNAAPAAKTLSAPSISPLLGKTQWNQYEPYNNLCPILYFKDGQSGRCITGCVATAMAQVMYYHKWPAQTTKEIPGYTQKYSNTYDMEVPAIPVTTIDWGNMLPRYNGSETDEQNNAVAQLMVMCGTSVHMSYSPGGSSANSARVSAALKEYFDYAATTTNVSRSDYKLSEWNELIYNELAEGRPVVYGGQSSGGGHEFVIDGYDKDDYFHVNWGWGGSSDGYFLLSILNPYSNQGAGASSSQDGYSYDQDANIGIQKNTGQTVETATKLTTLQMPTVTGNATPTRQNASEDFSSSVNFYFWNTTGGVASFDYAIGLFDSNGSLLKVMSETTASSFGVGIYTWGSKSVTFGSGLDDGTYRLVGVSRLNGVQTWYANANSNSYYIQAVIAGNQLTLSQPTISLEGSIPSDLTGRVGKPCDIVVNVTNTGSDFNQETIFYVDGNSVGRRYFDIDAGETGILTFPFVPTAAGTKSVRVTYEKDGSEVTLASGSIVVSEAPVTNLTLKPKVANAVNGIVPISTLKINVSVANQLQDAYDDNIRCRLYKNTPGTSNYSYVTDLDLPFTIGGNQTGTLTFSFENLDDGKYWVFTYYLSAGSWVESGDVFATLAISEVITPLTINGYYANAWLDADFSLCAVMPVQYGSTAQTQENCIFNYNLLNLFTLNSDGEFINGLTNNTKWDIQFDKPQTISGYAPNYTTPDSAPLTEGIDGTMDDSSYGAYSLVDASGNTAASISWNAAGYAWKHSAKTNKPYIFANHDNTSLRNLLNPIQSNGVGNEPTYTYDKVVNIGVWGRNANTEMVEVKKFGVALIDPLAIEAYLIGYFNDAMMFSSISTKDAVSIVDFRGFEVADKDPGNTEFTRYRRQLYNYYEVSEPVWDTDNVRYGLSVKNYNVTVDDNIDYAQAMTAQRLRQYTNGNMDFSVSFDSESSSLVFRNNGGTTISKPVNVFIPVKVAYGLGEQTIICKVRLYSRSDAPSNAVVAARLSALADTKATLPIKFESAYNVNGCQFDLTLPEGMTIADDGSGLDITLSDLAVDHIVTATQQGNGVYHIEVNSIDDTPFTAKSGTLMEVGIDIAPTVGVGSYTVKVNNANFSIRLGSVNRTIGASGNTASIEICDAQQTSYSLAQGWSWVSVRLTGTNASTNAKTFMEQFGDNAQRLTSQTQELIKDPDYGLVGNLTTLVTGAGYKLQLNSAENVDMSGQAADLSTEITLKKGWNWLGYLPAVALPIETAFENLTPTVGDVLWERDGSSQYTVDGWIPNIKLEPGKGYMYKSTADDDVTFTYSTATSGPASRQHTQEAVQPMTPWQYDAYRYPDNMSLVASLPADMPSSRYAVAAFVGEECRGVGRWAADRLFITVHGTSADHELVTLRRYDTVTGETTDIVETFCFDADSHGTVAMPLMLTFDAITGIDSMAASTNCFDVYTTGGQLVRRLATSLKGLPTGVYIVGGKKIVIR